MILMGLFQLEIFYNAIICPYSWTAAAPHGGHGFAPAVQIQPLCTVECIS